MTALCISSDPDVPGVVRISSRSTFPRPRIGVIGALHGDERCGLSALLRLREAAERGELPLLEGTLVLIHGNPEATEAGERHTAEGDDLNRLFDFHFEDILPLRQWTSEHHRAVALRPVLRSLDAALDLHSASIPTTPFAIAMPDHRSLELARHLGLEYVTTRWDGAGLGEKVALAILVDGGKPGVAVECGHHDEAEAERRAHAFALRFLVAAGLLEGEVERGSPRLLEVVSALRKPSAGFRFDRPIRGMDPLEAGEVIGRDGDALVRVDRDCFALLPNDSVAEGKPMLFVASPAEPGQSADALISG